MKTYRQAKHTIAQDNARTGKNVGAYLVFLQERSEVWTIGYLDL
jgi:hypothetical protein